MFVLDVSPLFNIWFVLKSIRSRSQTRASPSAQTTDWRKGSCSPFKKEWWGVTDKYVNLKTGCDLHNRDSKHALQRDFRHLCCFSQFCTQLSHSAVKPVSWVSHSEDIGVAFSHWGVQTHTEALRANTEKAQPASHQQALSPCRPCCSVLKHSGRSSSGRTSSNRLVCTHRRHCEDVQMYVQGTKVFLSGLQCNMQDTAAYRSLSRAGLGAVCVQSRWGGSVAMQWWRVGAEVRWGWQKFVCVHLIMTCPVSFVAEPGWAPAVFCTSDSMWTDSCSPPAASCAPAPDGTCSAGPSRLGQVQQWAPFCTHREEGCVTTGIQALTGFCHMALLLHNLNSQQIMNIWSDCDSTLNECQVCKWGL